ncbi:putative zinc carboxypeptidase [Leptomonas seymouri]|uniref:Cytosolic carboxypeptidase-like protein 5 n=1 Tax=Leptomonas seymouri TaxID=5684 RepID=A0A0N1HSB1_LEPSE|nr:putative zinc carboxypeptidase [Leptomonas seymouri]|eukprot:KPI83481.1 putative zinc carboxypeptidase [Leptomonas seymouri]
MPLDNSASSPPESYRKDPQVRSIESSAQPLSSQIVRILSSTDSAAGTGDGQDNEHILRIDANHSKGVNEACNQSREFPENPLEFSSNASSTALPDIAAQQRRRTAPISASPATITPRGTRGSPQKPALPRRLSRCSLSRTSPRGAATARIVLRPPVTNIVNERRPENGTQHLQKSGRTTFVSTPRTGRSPSPSEQGPDPRVVSPPPVHFSFHSPTPTGQRAPLGLQVLTSTAPQTVLPRAGSRPRPSIGLGSAVSPAGSPQTHAIQSTESASPSSCTPPPRTAASLPRSPSSGQVAVPSPSTRTRVSSRDLIHDLDRVSSSVITEEDADDTAPAATLNAEEELKDLLVDDTQKPRKMGQRLGRYLRTQSPREASNARLSPAENASRLQHSDGQSENTSLQASSLSCSDEARCSGQRQHRCKHTTPFNERSTQYKSDLSSTGGPSNGAEIDDAHWVFQRPPNNQRTFYFREDNLEFSSQFDSGNLIQVERVGPFLYRMYTAMDCGNSAWQTNNRQWFHFSLRGGRSGAVVTFTFVGMMHSNMFNFDWMPVSAMTPSRPEYTRLPGKAKVEPLENMPETPGYPLLVLSSVLKDGADSDGDNNEDENDADVGAGGNASSNRNNTGGTGTGGVAFSIAVNSKSGAANKKKKGNKKKKYCAMNLTFDYKIELETPVTHTPPKGRPDVMAIYIASNHPYTYKQLQRNLLTWQAMAGKGNVARSHSVQPLRQASPLSSLQPNEPAADGRASQTPNSAHLSDTSGHGAGSTCTVEVPFSGIYFHREVLCKTLEGNDVTLLTISDCSRMTTVRAPLISEKDGIPYSSANHTTERPYMFTDKKYVVLTARVHPGECPGSHLMHGCIEFLMNSTDPRAAALRHNFVFYVVPMLNPDGVIRGHSRVDANGADLNRMYRTPSLKRHPAPYSVVALLKPLGDRVALFVDMHAHANRRGTFFYGNSMDGADQVENFLYAKLVSLNTPYLDFRSCNFSEANMFAVGRSGKGKDSSSRVVVYTEAGIVHGYTIETSYVMAEAINPVVPLVNAEVEELEKVLPAPLQLAHTPATFGDTGRALLVALLDLKGINPLSRLPYTPFHSTRGVSMWLQRQLQIETAEMLFAQAFKSHGKEVQAASQETGANLLGPIMRSLTTDEFPDKITIKNARLLPCTTYSGVRYFLPMETAVALLLQTAPTGPPRSLLYPNVANAGSGAGGNGNRRRRGASPAVGNHNNAVDVAAASSAPRTDLPVVIATKRRPRPGAAEADMTVES